MMTSGQKRQSLARMVADLMWTQGLHTSPALVWTQIWALSQAHPGLAGPASELVEQALPPCPAQFQGFTGTET